MNDQLRIVFAGTPAFAVPALEALVAAGHTLAGVLTQPDRPAGRGRQARPSAVKRAAQALGLPVRQPETLRDPAALAALRALAPSVIVVAAYGLVVPRRLLTLAPLGCVNIHPSLLPRWRGAAPIQRALLAGDTETGVTLMRMTSGLDVGPVLAQARAPIYDDDTGGSLHDRLAELGAELLVQSLPRYATGKLEPVPQPEEGVTYAEKVSKAEAELNWTQPAVVLERRVRAFNPRPVAHCRHHGQTLRVWRARCEAAEVSAAPGTVLALDPDVAVATGSGVLHLEELQAPGRRPQPASVFVNGYRLAVGERLDDHPGQ